MGLSHQAIIGAHPELELAGVCDTTGYLLDVLNKYTGVATYGDYRKLLDEARLDCVFIATPSKVHAEMVRYALERGVHVFCEKPFVLDVGDGERLAQLASERGLVNQVGYHYRFVAAFAELRRLLAAGALGTLHHIRAEAYGPVVLRPKGSTWRSAKSEGGGCLYDYACHAIDLMNYLVGPPRAVSGTVLGRVFSRDVEDEVYSTFHYEGGLTGQLAANWSDESFRKMSTKVSAWGTNGRITADRQEVQIYLREPVAALPDLRTGWSIRYTTDLTAPVWYYLRGEEYSAQIDHFVGCLRNRAQGNLNSFASAVATDRVVAMLLADAAGGGLGERPAASRGAERRRFLGGLFGGDRN